MRIICLNTWGGRGGKEMLLAFFAKHRDTTDVFCLQEIWSDRYEDLEGSLVGGNAIDHSAIMTHGLQDISATLPDHTTYFRPHYRENYGLCMFVRSSMTVTEEGEIFVHRTRDYIPPPEGDIGNHARNLQYVTIEMGDQKISVLNFHGLWNGKGKGDSEERLLQSDRIIEFLCTLQNPYVLCGDFNLTPDTESLKKLENFGLENLIATHGITSTRTSFYTKEEKYADYAFVSSGIVVKEFKVLPDEVSDHAPLYLEIA